MTRRIHFGTDPHYPLRTLCGAGKMGHSAWGRARWRGVRISHDRKAVDCTKCQRLLKKEAK